jgi:lipoprotein-anchoring transpeptidase ErfK/SrfK
MSMAGAATVDAAVKTYWDQATGKWMKYDTKANKAAPVSPDAGATTQMGQTPQTYKNANPVPRRTVDYDGPFKPNTIVVNTAERRLYYIMPNGKALKYGVGVGREGFTWAGVENISRKAEWPGWTPPPEMIAREKKKGRILPAYMEGGVNNPLGARALYIGGTLYRIHGSNEPWTIGQAVSSGCIRMTNDDVSHLYERVKVGTRVVVLRGDESATRLAALANPPPPKKEAEVQVAEARTKDDALASIGIGIAVAGIIPADEATSVETTASVEPAEPPAAAAEPAPVEAAAVPEAAAKDDDLAAVMPDEAAPDEAPAVAEASALPVDDTAKDDAIEDTVAAVEPAVVAPSDEVAETTPELGDAAVAPVETDAAAEAKDSVPPADATPVAEPLVKDDGLATDLGGKPVPIEGAPDLSDDTAATNTLVKPATAAN